MARQSQENNTEPALGEETAKKGSAEVCDNHPDREAVFSTDGNGAFQTIRFCEECVPRHWR